MVSISIDGAFFASDLWIMIWVINIHVLIANRPSRKIDQQLVSLIKSSYALIINSREEGADQTIPVTENLIGRVSANKMEEKQYPILFLSPAERTSPDFW